MDSMIANTFFEIMAKLQFNKFTGYLQWPSWCKT